MKKPRIKDWVLKDGKNYFRQWTGIGPRACQKLSDAERFLSERAALQSPAFSFWLTSYEPVAVRALHQRL